MPDHSRVCAVQIGFSERLCVVRQQAPARLSRLSDDIPRRRRQQRPLEPQRHRAAAHHPREVVEAAEPPLAALRGHRPLVDVHQRQGVSAPTLVGREHPPIIGAIEPHAFCGCLDDPQCVYFPFETGCSAHAPTDMHEIAVVSGFAAAYQLGAPFVSPPSLPLSYPDFI